MINTKQTLKNLHKKFPMMSLDELFEVLDCYVEEDNLFTTLGNKPTWEPIPNPNKMWYNSPVTSISTTDSGDIASNGNFGISTIKS